MVLCYKKGNKQSMSDSNIEVCKKTSKKLPYEVGNNCKECCTFSSQHNAPKVPEVPLISNCKQEVLQPLKCPNIPQPCTYPPCACPPYPYPPQDDLWDLQFCRWWGWNWIRKRDEIVNNQKKSYCTRRRGKSPKKFPKKHKNPKQDDFFSWCNKLFKGRQKECPLKTEEKRHLQDMYDTPSLVTISKCCQPSLPNWDCKSVNLQKNKCYCNSGRQTSMSTIFIKNKTKRNCEKINRRRHQYLCERGESTSSEEHCPHVYHSPKAALSSTEESVEYLALRMECLNSDNETNCRRHQRRLKCCQPQVCPTQIKNRFTKNACPYKFKAVCEEKVNTEPCRKHLMECNRIGDPYNGQFSQWTCKCGRHCTCLKDTSPRFPQFSKYPRNKCIPRQDPIETRTTKEYIIHCPLVHCKKQKKYCTCCNNCKPVDCECKYNNCKVMIDKCVSCPDMIKNQYQTKPQNYKIAFQDSIAATLKNGQFSSPVSGKLYELNPRVICGTSIPNHSSFPNPIDVNHTFLNFYNDSSETHSVDKEHNVILAAVCEAIMSSRSSDQGTEKVIEEEVTNYDYLFMDNYSDVINSLNNGNYNYTNRIEKYTQKPIHCTDRFIGSYGKNGKSYETVPLKAIKTAGIAGSRIPLLKRKLNESTSTDHTNILKLANEYHPEIISNNVSRFNSPSINKKIRTDISSYHIEKDSEKSDNLNTNTGSFKYPRSLIRSPKLPGISINGLFSAISNTFTKNHLDKNDKKTMQSTLLNRGTDSIRLNSMNSNLNSQPTTSLTEPFLHSPLASFTENSSPSNNVSQGLYEDNYSRKNKLGIETLHRYVAHDTTPNAQVDPINVVSSSSHLDSFSNNIDLNLYNFMHSNNIKSDAGSDVNPNNIINFTCDSNYFEHAFKSNTVSYKNPQSYLRPVDTEDKKNEHVTISNILQIQQTFKESKENELFRGLCEQELENFVNTKKDMTTNTAIRKSRIPIQDAGVRDCHRLVPIIEEYNVEASHTETNSEIDNIACSNVSQS